MLLSLALLCGVQSLTALAEVCAVPGKDGSVFNPNTYYAGAAGSTAPIGSLSISLGSKRTDFGVSSDVGVGDLVLIVQMQDALINNSDSISYGDGSTGRGYTNLRGAGYYEFNVVGGVAGGTLTLKNPLIHTYINADADNSNGQRRFQIVRVPQFTSLQLSADITVPAWDGSSGGVFALSVAGNLDLNNHTIDASYAGFRGGGSRFDDVVSGKGIVNYATPFTTARANFGAFKGEGIAGTPRFVRDQTLTAVAYTGKDLGTSGYPIGTVDLDPDAGVDNYTFGLDRSRGAPGNAGGGGNQHNAGGGGGGNVGQGGTGGNSFAFYKNTDTGNCVDFGSSFFGCDGDGARPVGGLGGAGILPSSAYPNAERLIVGGGGGAGDNNNADDNSSVPQASGGNGGGVIFLVANQITGPGTLKANGQDGQPAGRDAAGGGGAGGTVAIATNSINLSSLSVQVNGGAGGNSALPLRGGETQGPGGGGGGGAVLLTTNITTPPGTSLTGGIPGVNNPATGITNVYGGSAGVGGKGNIVYNNTAIPQTPFCFPQLTVTKKVLKPGDARTVSYASGLTLNQPTDAQQPEYLISISNAPGKGAATGVRVFDTLPTPLTYAGPTTPATPTGVTSRTATTDPTSGQTALTFGDWTLEGGSTLELRFPINRLQGVGTFQNSATTSFIDPTSSSAVRVGPGGTYTSGGAVSGSNYVSSSSALEDLIVQSDLSVTKQAVKTGTNTAQTVRANTQSFDYLVTVSNLKAVNTTNITVSDILPGVLTPGTLTSANFIATPTNPSVGTVTFSANTLTIPNLAPGQSLTMRLPVTVNSSAASKATNTATLSAATPVDNGSNGSSTLNNSAAVDVFLNPITLTKTVQKVLPTPVGVIGTSVIAKPGDTLEYCITATSLLGTASAVNVSDTLLPNQTFVVGSITVASPSNFTSPTVTGTLAGVVSGTPKTMCFRTTVN